jgi:hypothetical protein
MGVAEVAEFLPAIVSSSDNDGDVHQRHSEVHRD